MDSICLYTNLFTLADKEVSKNLYVQMFLIWLKYVKRNAGLSAADQVVLICDSRTYQYLDEHPFFRLMVNGLCPFTVLLVKPPTTLTEGCLNRFTMYKKFEQKYLMYLDVDIIVEQPLRKMLKEGYDLLVHAEGKLEDDNYGIHLKSTGLPIKSGLPGFSSGKFIICSESVRDKLFKFIGGLGNQYNYYCLDQPLFNFAVYALYAENQIKFSTQEFADSISINFYNYVKGKVILLDLCGEPGDAFMHLEKMIGYTCMH